MPALSVMVDDQESCGDQTTTEGHAESRRGKLYIVRNPIIVYLRIYLRLSAFEKGSEFPPPVFDQAVSYMTSRLGPRV